MASTYRLHSLAKKELNDAIDWYEKDRKGRGRKFFIAYLEAIRFILASPLACPLVFAETRKMQVQKFPYTIFYEVFGDEIFVYSLFHNSREPAESIGSITPSFRAGSRENIIGL